MPASLRIPVLYHHCPEKADSIDEQSLNAIRIQCLAGMMGEWMYIHNGEKEQLEELNNYAMKYFGIPQKNLEALLYSVDRQVEEISSLLELTSPMTTTPAG